MKKFFTIWWIALAVKTAFAIWLPFSNDEAYYWVWGHHPELSYFDHPPAVSWLFTIGRVFENLGNGARLPGVWLGHLTLIIWARILDRYLSPKQLSFWLIFVLFSPLFGIGSFIITPDVPLLFFWSLSILILISLLDRPKASLYAALGASLGFGFCSKYLIVLFVPIAVAWLATSGKWRRVRLSYIPITLMFGLLFCAPVLYWNWQHEWVSFAFQLNHGLGTEHPKLSWPIEYAAGQLAILFPTTVYFALRYKPKKFTAIEPADSSLLSFFGWLPLGFFLYTAFRAHVEANWPTMAHPALLSLAVISVFHGPKAATKNSNLGWLKLTIGVWIAALLVVVSQLVHPWIPVNPKKLKTNEFTRFDALAAYGEKYGSQFYLGSYQMAAAVSYKLRKPFYKLRGLNRKDFYDFIPQSIPNGDTFFVGVENGQSALPTWMKDDLEYNYSETLLTKLEGVDMQIYEVTRRAKDPHL